MTTGPGDAELLQKWVRGDERAGRDFFAKYRSPILRFFRSKIGTDRGGDPISETFLRFIQGVREERLRDYEKARAYLYAIAWNVVRETVKRKATQPQRVDFDSQSFASVVPVEFVDPRAPRLLLEALRTIPIHGQVVLELCREGFTDPEIGGILGLPPRTVQSRRRRAERAAQQAVQTLARSPEELHTTQTQLADWAAQMRATAGLGSEFEGGEA